MKQSNKVVTAAVAIAAAAGLAITGAALASADPTTQATTPGGYGGVAPEGSAPGGMAGGGQDPSRPMHPGETLLTGTVKDKVTAPAKAKEPGATIERVETDAEGVYEAHMVRADGTPIIVQVDRSFAVTAVQVGGPGGGHGEPGAGPDSQMGQQLQPDQPAGSGGSGLSGGSGGAGGSGLPGGSGELGGSAGADGVSTT